jgi:hypothetical protein
MTDDISDRLVPYVYGTSWNIDKLALDVGLDRDIEVLEFSNAEHAAFADLWVRGNQIAFGGLEDMGMPSWVFVDCVIMAFAAVGFMLPADQTPEAVRRELEIPDDYDGWVPISEYSICPTVEADTVAAFSLQSRIQGRGIGTRTKALGLYTADVDFQTGVTQYTSPALRVHTRFGPMEVLVDRPPAHDHSEKSLAYRLDVPSQAELARLAAGEPHDPSVSSTPDGERWTFEVGDPESHEHLSSHLEEGGCAWVVQPGMEMTADGAVVSLVLGD